MGIPNKQIGWGTKENLLWQIAKQLEKLTYQIYNTGGGGGSVTSVGLTSSTPSITITGSPVTGSGNLNFEIGTASSLAPGLLSSADWTTFNSKQGAITLTTSGTSGAATLIGNILNIPQYSGTNIYNSDGTLAGNRQVTLGGNRLDVIGSLSTTTFASNGNIGIGTNSPAVYPNYTTLEINNSVAGGLIALSGGGSLRAQMYVDGNGLNIRSVGNQLLQLGANSIGALYIYPLTQNVSIGTSVDAGYKLNVEGITRIKDYLDIQDAAGTTMRFQNLGGGIQRIVGGSSFSVYIDLQPNEIALNTNNCKITGLAGVGSRMVVADSTGILSTQAIPGGGGNTIYTGDGSLTANRTLTYNNYSLTFSGSGSSIFTSSVGYYSARFGSQFFGDQWLFLGNDNNCPALQGNNAAFNSPQPIALNANGGNVGVGILTPEERLHVVGNTIIKYAAFSGAKLIMNNTSTGAKSYSIYSGGSSNLIGAGAFAIADETAGVNRLVISTAGNILIGTTTDAGYKLDVAGTIRLSDQLVFKASLSYYPTLKLTNIPNSVESIGLSLWDGAGTTLYKHLIKMSNTGDGFNIVINSGTNLYGPYPDKRVTIEVDNTNLRDFEGIDLWQNITSFGDKNIAINFGWQGANYDPRTFARISAKNGTANNYDPPNPSMDFWVGDTNVPMTLRRAMSIDTTLSVMVGTTTPVASSIMTLSSTTRGFLPPRMTGTQAEAIATPSEGLMVYSTDGSGTIITSKGWWGYEGSTWVKLN
jgi:hypothetical protein